MNPARYAKAIIGALVAGLGTLATALADDGITATEWVWVALAVLTALGTVAAVPNRRPDAVDELADHDRRAQREDLAERLAPPTPPSVPDPGISERARRRGEHRRNREPPR